MQIKLLALLDIPTPSAPATTQSGSVRHSFESSQNLRVGLVVLGAKYKRLTFSSLLPIREFSYQVVGDENFALFPGLRVESPLILGLNPERLVCPINVAESQVHQLMVAQAAFESDQDASRMYASAAANSALVWSDEYTVGSFSSYLGTGGRIDLSIPANRSHDASLVCLLATVRSPHPRFRVAAWKLETSSLSTSSTYAFLFFLIRSMNSAVTSRACYAASFAFRPSASLTYAAAVSFNVLRPGFAMTCTSVPLAASMAADVFSNRARLASASAAFFPAGVYAGCRLTMWRNSYEAP